MQSTMTEDNKNNVSYTPLAYYVIWGVKVTDPMTMEQNY